MSASTLEAYTLDLAMLSRWAARPGDLDLVQLTSADLTRYVVDRAAQGIQLSTLARHLSPASAASMRSWSTMRPSPRNPAVKPSRYRTRSGRQSGLAAATDVVRSLLRAPRGRVSVTGQRRTGRSGTTRSSACCTEPISASPMCASCAGSRSTSTGTSSAPPGAAARCAAYVARCQRCLASFSMNLQAAARENGCNVADEHLLLSHGVRPANDPPGALPRGPEMGQRVRPGPGGHAVRDSPDRPGRPARPAPGPAAPAPLAQRADFEAGAPVHCDLRRTAACPDAAGTAVCTPPYRGQRARPPPLTMRIYPCRADEPPPENVLLKANALQNAILGSATFSIIATDDQGIIQLFNRGAERMLGYTAAEVVNRISPSDIHDQQEVCARALALSDELGTPMLPASRPWPSRQSRGIEDIYELTYIRKDGTRFPAVVSITALHGEADDIIGYLLIGADNSQRKRIEENLHEAMAAAENANRGQDRFPLQHEPRAAHAAQCHPRLRPARRIWLSRRRRRRRRRSLEQILKAGWYLLELINEILDLSLIESGNVTMSREPVSLAEVMLECRAMIEPQAGKRGIKMTFPLPSRRPCFINADRTQGQAGPHQPAVQRRSSTTGPAGSGGGGMHG